MKITFTNWLEFSQRLLPPQQFTRISIMSDISQPMWHFHLTIREFYLFNLLSFSNIFILFLSVISTVPLNEWYIDTVTSRSWNLLNLIKFWIEWIFEMNSKKQTYLNPLKALDSLVGFYDTFGMSQMHGWFFEEKCVNFKITVNVVLKSQNRNLLPNM